MSHLFLRDTKGKEHFIDKEMLKLGRAVDNDIVIKDLSISRYHLAIQTTDGSSLVIHNTGSESGFFINGQSFQDVAQAHLGDIIQVGNQQFKVESLMKTEAAPLFDAIPDVSTNVSLDLNSKNKKIRMVLVVIVIAMAAAAMMKPKEQSEGPETAAAPDKKATVGLPAESYNEYDAPKKGPQEITADNLYQKGMREYDNANYIRAMQFFQQSLTEDPTSMKAQLSLRDAEAQLNRDITKLVTESEQNYVSGRYTYARSLSVQALNLLSEQIPGFSYQIQQKLRNIAAQKLPQLSRENFYLDLNCELTPQGDVCKRAVDVFKRCRQKLGEENVLK